MHVTLVWLWLQDTPKLGPEPRLGHASSVAVAGQNEPPQVEKGCCEPWSGHRYRPETPGDHDNQVTYSQRAPGSLQYKLCCHISSALLPSVRTKTSVNTVQYIPFFLCWEHLCTASNFFCPCWKKGCRILCSTCLIQLLLYLKTKTEHIFRSVHLRCDESGLT